MSPFLSTASNMLLLKGLCPYTLEQMDSRFLLVGYLASVKGRRKFFGTMEY